MRYPLQEEHGCFWQLGWAAASAQRQRAVLSTCGSSEPAPGLPCWAFLCTFSPFLAFAVCSVSSLCWVDAVNVLVCFAVCEWLLWKSWLVWTVERERSQAGLLPFPRSIFDGFGMSMSTHSLLGCTTVDIEMGACVFLQWNKEKKHQRWDGRAFWAWTVLSSAQEASEGSWEGPPEPRHLNWFRCPVQVKLCCIYGEYECKFSGWL